MNRLLRLLFLVYPILPVFIAVGPYLGDFFLAWLRANPSRMDPIYLVWLSLRAADSLWLLALFLVALLFMRDVARRLRRPWLATLSTWILVFSATRCLHEILRSAEDVLFRLRKPHDHSIILEWVRDPLSVVTRVLPNLFEANNWLAIGTQVFFWLLVALVIRRTTRHPLPERPAGLLIDPAPIVASRPEDPNRFAAFRMSRIRSGGVALALTPPFAFLSFVADRNIASHLLPVTFFPIFAVVSVALGWAATFFLATSRRRPTKRHVSRTFVVAILLTCAFAQIMILATFPPRLTHPLLDLTVDDPLLFLCFALAIAAQAFFLNFIRETSTQNLAAWTRIAPAVAILLLLVPMIRPWLIDLVRPTKSFAFLDPLWLAFTLAALALLTLYAAILASTLLRLPTPSTPPPPKLHP